MKKLIFIFILFASLQITYAQKSDRPKDRIDPIPQTSKPTPELRDTSPEQRLWFTAINKFDHVETDSSSGINTRIIASFEGVKFQLRKGTGNLSTVTKWEYRNVNTQHGSLFLYIFTLQNKEKVILSLRPVEGYKKIIFFFEARGENPISIDAYVPSTYQNITKITLIF